MAQHARYFSCTKQADWIRGTPKPHAASFSEWNKWYKLAKTAHPIRYWIAEEALGKIQDFITWPKRTFRNFTWWLENRFITHSNALTSNLKRGQWHDLSERMLHCPFDELVDFVEIETAYSHLAWGNEETKAKYKIKKHYWFNVDRCPQAGLDHLEWASKLVMDEDMGVLPDNENYGKLTRQAIAAQDILMLYTWWKETRPARPDPYDTSGWSDFCAKRRADNDGEFMWEDKTEEESIISKNLLKICSDIEDEYEKEDTAMLTKLISIRSSLWT